MRPALVLGRATAGPEVKIRRNGHTVAAGGIIADGIDTDSQREVLSRALGLSEAEGVRTGLRRNAADYEVRCAKLVIAARGRQMGATMLERNAESPMRRARSMTEETIAPLRRDRPVLRLSKAVA